jgi:hypothetical protein
MRSGDSGSGVEFKSCLYSCYDGDSRGVRVVQALLEREMKVV